MKALTEVLPDRRPPTRGPGRRRSRRTCLRSPPTAGAPGRRPSPPPPHLPRPHARPAWGSPHRPAQPPARHRLRPYRWSGRRPYPTYGAFPTYPGYPVGFDPPGRIRLPYAYPRCPVAAGGPHTLTRELAVGGGGDRGVGGPGRWAGGCRGRGRQPADHRRGASSPTGACWLNPQDVQEVLAKVEPAVVSIDSQSGAGRSEGTSSRPPVPG